MNVGALWLMIYAALNGNDEDIVETANTDSDLWVFATICILSLITGISSLAYILNIIWR